MNNEARLAIACARIELDAAQRDALGKLAASAIDWNEAIAFGARHGLLPLMHRHLEAAAPESLPRLVRAQLWGIYELTKSRHARNSVALVRILTMFDAHGIASIPYKGPVLARSLYADIGLREFTDLDILVRKRDVLRAKGLLEADGFRSEYALQPTVEAALLRARAQYHLMLVDEERDVAVEIHWKTDADFPVERSDDEAWWADLPTMDFDGLRIRTFPPAELMLILCLHGTKHHWDTLRWLVDIAQLIRAHPDLDWNWMRERAASLGCERRLAIGLHLVRDLLDAPLPDPVARQIDRDGPARNLATRMKQRLFEFESGAAWWRQLQTNLALYERPGQKLRHGYDVLLAPSLIEWSQWPLPRALFFLYPPLRLVRLAGKYASILTKKAL